MNCAFDKGMEHKTKVLQAEEEERVAYCGSWSMPTPG